MWLPAQEVATSDAHRMALWPRDLGKRAGQLFSCKKAKAEDEKPLLLRAPQAGIARPPGPSCPGCELGSLKRHAPSAREGRASRDGQWARLCGGGGDSRCPRWTGQHVCAERCPSPCKPSHVTSCFTPHSHPPTDVRGAGGSGRRGETPSLSPGALWSHGEHAVGHAGTACARVPAWGATCVWKCESLGGGPPACRPPPDRRAHARLFAPPATQPLGRPRPCHRLPPAHASLPGSPSGRCHAADGRLVFVGQITPKPHSTPSSSPHFTAEETEAQRSAHSCLKAQPDGQSQPQSPFCDPDPLCSPASSSALGPRAHLCFGETELLGRRVYTGVFMYHLNEE